MLLLHSASILSCWYFM